MTKKLFLAGLLALVSPAAWALENGAFRKPSDANKLAVENPAWVGLSVSSKSAAGTVTANSKHVFLQH